MVDACAASGIRAFYGPFGDLKDEAGCEAQFRNAFLMGCTGAWSLAPNQIAIAKRVFSPDVKEVLFAKRILEAMPDGTGVAMLDGKMQDDATWKQAKVIVDLARLVAQQGPGAGARPTACDRPMSARQDPRGQLLRGLPRRPAARCTRTPRTVTDGDVALYQGLFGSRFAVNSSDPFARTLGLPRAPLDRLLAFHLVFGKTVPTCR